MKKFNWAFLSLPAVLFFSTYLHSCKKINEATELGSDLIPEVDNINTFETTLGTETNNVFNFTDPIRIGYNDDMALGAITSDPEFGKTSASIYANLNPPTFAYPFYVKDSVLGIDSVVLSLAYKGSYGDTSLAAVPTTVRVFEVSQNADFNDSSTYLTTRDEFAVGSQLGTSSFRSVSFKDSITLIRKRDTTKVANALRIKLDNAFGEKLKNLDTSSYKSYSAFYNAVKGIALKPDAVGNTLSYFALSETTKSRVIVYYRVTRNGIADTSSAIFGLGRSTVSSGVEYGTVANIIKRTPEASYATYLNNGNLSDDKLFIQSSPGSLGVIRVPGLDTLSNYVIHRAELVATKLSSLNEGIFQTPPVLYLDQGSLLDSATQIEDNAISATTISQDRFIRVTIPNFSIFGGRLRSDNTYRFALTKHIQRIVTSGQRNFYLRLLAPVRVIYQRPQILPQGAQTLTEVVNVMPQVAYGRVVLAGGNFPDTSKRLRLRIIYSKIQ